MKHNSARRQINQELQILAPGTVDHEIGETKTMVIKPLIDIPRAIHDNHVFLYRGVPLKYIRRGLQKGCKGANIKYGRMVPGGFVYHDLRHTFNTNMREACVPESVIMKITCHSTREMFDHTTPLIRMTDIRQFQSSSGSFQNEKIS